MRKLWNSIVNMFRGNRLWVGIGVGVVGATTLIKSETKPFYYGILAVIVLLKLLGSKVLGKWNNYAILACIGVFLWAFVAEVWFKKDNSTQMAGSWFSTLWNKIASYFPTTNTQN